MTYENEAVGQHTVDLCGGVVFSSEVGLGNGELFSGFLVRVKPVIYDQRDERGCGPDADGRGICEPSITKRVMQHGLGLEMQGTRCTHDMDNRDMLGEGWYDRHSAQ